MDAVALRRSLSCGRAGCPCGRGANTHCPAHDDTRPSLTVNNGFDGRVLIHCKTGCEQPAVIAALHERGLWPDETQLASPNRPRTAERVLPLEKRVALYDYRDGAGKLIAQKARFEAPDGRKTFKWRLPDAEGWPGLGGTLRLADVPLWGAELVTAADPNQVVWLVEGEKAALAGRDAGLLAVTHGGGAGTTDFGASLDVLTDRDVRLWPDNDESGRQFMARVAAKLRPIARSIRLIDVPIPMPEKGDAADYFARGGTVEAIDAALPPSEPVVELIAHDSVRVRTPGPLGLVSFSFTEMEKTGRAFDTEVTVQLAGPGRMREPYSQRINLLSLSQKTELRRELEAVFDKTGEWARLLNTAIRMATETWTNQERGLRYSEIPDPGPLRFLVRPLVPAGVPTVWYGQGSAGKTYLAYQLGVSCALGSDFAGIPVQRGAAMVVDFENNADKFRYRVRRLLGGLELDPETDLDFYHWPAKGMPLIDQVTPLRRFITERGISLVIVDSAAPACGGKPSDEENALRYFQALSKLPDGVASLTLAHIAKGSDSETPFGSVFWHNMARSTWFIARVQDEESDLMNIGMYAKKSNDGARGRPVGLRVQFQGEDGPVLVQADSLVGVPELNERRSLKWQIADILRPGARTIYEIAATLSPDDDEEDRKRLISSIGGCLRRDRGKMFIEIAGRVEAGRGQQGRWALAASAAAQAG